MDEALAVDLLVVGGGMAGMTAGARAAHAGARVLVVEKADRLGGSALLSNGYLWTVPDVDAFLTEDPHGDSTLAAALVSGFAGAVEWVRSLGVDVSARVPVLGIGHGHRIDIGAYLQRCRAVVESASGWVLTGTHTRTLRRREDGVVGAHVVDARGDGVDVEARTTVLATGGLQGDRGLLADHLGPARAEQLLLRSNPHSTGDGLRLARGIGASDTVGTGGFYGHLVASPLDHFAPPDFLRLAALHSPTGILLDWTGRRFCDETLGDHHNAQAVLDRPGARAVLVVDSPARADMVAAPLIEGMEQLDVVADARAAGARLDEADDLDRLREHLISWGVDATTAERTLGEAPRLRHGPYVAMEVRPAITFAYGGIRVADDAAVLDQVGRPIPGLRAAGGDVGGLYHRGYAGGLSVAAVLGLAAADATSRGGGQ